MKIAQEKAEKLESTNVDFKEKGFRIDTLDPSFLIKMVADLYTNPRRTLLTEYLQNAVDSHTMARKKGLDVPFPVKVFLPTILDPYYRVRDFGVGMTAEDIEEIFSVVFRSNKRDSDDYIGGMGVGKLVFSPYCGVMHLNTFSGSNKQEWIIRLKDGQGGYTLISDIPSNEPRGVEVLIPVVESDNRTLHNIAEFLYAFIGEQKEPVQVIGNDKPIFDWKSNVQWHGKNEDWYLLDVTNIDSEVIPTPSYSYARSEVSYSSEYKQVLGNNAFVTLDGLPFPLDNNILSQPLRRLKEDYGKIVNTLLNTTTWFPFKTGELDHTPARDALKYNDKTLMALAERIGSCVREIQDRITKTLASIDSLYDWKSLLYSCKIKNKYTKQYNDKITLGGKTIPIELIRCVKPNKLQWRGKTYDVSEYTLTCDEIQDWIKNKWPHNNIRVEFGSAQRNHQNNFKFIAPAAQDNLPRRSTYKMPSLDCIGDNVFFAFGRNCGREVANQRLNYHLNTSDHGDSRFKDKTLNSFNPNISSSDPDKRYTVVYIDFIPENGTNTQKEFSSLKYAKHVQAKLGLPDSRCIFVDKLTAPPRIKSKHSGTTNVVQNYATSMAFCLTLQELEDLGNRKLGESTTLSSKSVHIVMETTKGIYVELNNYKFVNYGKAGRMKAPFYEKYKDVIESVELSMEKMSPVHLARILRAAGLPGTQPIYLLKSETVRKIEKKKLEKNWEHAVECLSSKILNQKVLKGFDRDWDKWKSFYAYRCAYMHHNSCESHDSVLGLHAALGFQGFRELVKDHGKFSKAAYHLNKIEEYQKVCPKAPAFMDWCNPEFFANGPMHHALFDLTFEGCGLNIWLQDPEVFDGFRCKYKHNPELMKVTTASSLLDSQGKTLFYGYHGYRSTTGLSIKLKEGTDPCKVPSFIRLAMMVYLDTTCIVSSRLHTQYGARSTRDDRLPWGTFYVPSVLQYPLTAPKGVTRSFHYDILCDNPDPYQEKLRQRLKSMDLLGDDFESKVDKIIKDLLTIYKLKPTLLWLYATNKIQDLNHTYTDKVVEPITSKFRDTLKNDAESTAKLINTSIS